MKKKKVELASFPKLPNISKQSLSITPFLGMSN